MSTGLRRVPRQGKRRRYRLVPRYVTALLVLIAIVALVAKGPPQIYLYAGPSPFNQGSLGTSQLVILLRHDYPNTYIVTSLRDIEMYSKGRYCLYIVVSPQKPITPREASRIISYLRQCKHYAILIADESRNSNDLARALGAQTIVEGSIVLDAKTKSPYPIATFDVDGKVYRLKLDIASSISGCRKEFGYVSNAIILYPNKTFVVVRRACVGSIIRGDRWTLAVVSDGSIFLNQVLLSDVGAKYRDFILRLVSELCDNTSSCSIMVDGYHYLRISPLQVFRSPSLARFINPFALVPALIAYIIHPAVWLPPALRLANKAFAYALSSYGLSILVLGLLALIAYAIARRIIGSGSEQRVSPSPEWGSVFSTELHDIIARGRYSFSREDFLNLYALVDEALKSIVGLGLSDPRCVDVLSSYVGRERAARFVNAMNRYLDKARRKRILPIVLSWNRLVRRMLKEAEEILNSVGTSIAEKHRVLRA